MVLLIPRRIKQIKDEGREEWLEKGREEGRQEGFEEAVRAGLATRKPQTGDEDIERLKRLTALYDSGDITSEDVRAILSRRYSRNREAD